ncbi:MAG TPA: Gfo/Idh/MocA family oxidoreductase [Gemmatimonadota bacterium]|nr:Gfo/Idh/MocA family oxidoreductase [Gemmatimonadota bacterium]
MTGRPGSTVRVGVLGCGEIARYAHLRLLGRMPGVALVAAADPDPEARRRAEAMGVPVHATAEELLEREDLDAVVICAPTGVHADLARAAARTGRHFFVEKPLATTLEDARSVEAEARRAGVRAAVGFNRRFHPLCRQARDLLARGTIGRVRTVVTASCEPAAPGRTTSWRGSRASGGGVLLDLASHHLDLLRWFLDDEVVEVSASLSSDEAEDDSARLELTMEGGAKVHGAFSFRGGYADFLEFIGEEGSLRVDRHRPALDLRRRRRRGYGIRRGWIVPTPDVVNWRTTRVFRRVREPSYGRSLRAFVERVRGRPSGPLATLADGVRNVEIVVAAETSAREGRPVSIAPPAED